MPRCIVLIRSHEPLQEGWRKRSFGPAGPLLDDRVRVAGARFDDTYHPVQVWRRVGGGDDPPAASGFNYGGVAPAATYAVRWKPRTRTPSNGCDATASPRLSVCSPTLPCRRSPPPTAAPPRSGPLRTWPEGSVYRRSPGRG